jgi:hypothetical protein
MTGSGANEPIPGDRRFGSHPAERDVRTANDGSRAILRNSLCEMAPDPLPERQYRLRHRMPQFGQAVFDLRRAGREDRPRHDAVAFEAAQGAGQHLLRDPGRIALNVIEPAFQALLEQASLPTWRLWARTLPLRRSMLSKPEVTPGVPEREGDRGAGIAMYRTPIRRQRCRGSGQTLWDLMKAYWRCVSRPEIGFRIVAGVGANVWVW